MALSKETIKTIQYQLKKVLNISLSIDGDYGPSTRAAVKRFQDLHDLATDGVAGPKTRGKLENVYNAMFRYNSPLLTFGKPRFVVFVDAGHGGIDDNGNYVTIGKRAYHKGLVAHERGHYYEGLENRIIAEAFIETLTSLGVMTVRTYHPYKDTSLSDRTNEVRGWLRRGYYGYMHSFHSNAISLRNSEEKLKQTRGFMVFSTRGNTFSDEIATVHFKHARAEMGSLWNFRTDKSDGDEDYEANFQVLRETDLADFSNFGAILEEWGFHTSIRDVEFILEDENRQRRVMAAVSTALWVRDQLQQKLAL